jgi:hypothetical protein
LIFQTVKRGMSGGLDSFSFLSAGESHTCGIKKDGRVECWGHSYVIAPTDGAFKDLAGGYFSACGIRMDGSPQCWGFLIDDPTPADILMKIAVHDSHTACGLKENGIIICWGVLYR